MLTLIARYWNEVDWLEASLRQVELWNADKIFLCEGCWDASKPCHSTDDTLWRLYEWAEHYERQRRDSWGVAIVNVCRDFSNPRHNQAATSQWCMDAAQCRPGDWIVIVDADLFLPESAIRMMRHDIANNPPWARYEISIHHFCTPSLERAQLGVNRQPLVPYKVLPGATWIPTNHLALDGNQYELIPDRVPTRRLLDCCANGLCACHYEMQHDASRLTSRYSIGDRKTPDEAGRLASMTPFSCTHPKYVINATTPLDHHLAKDVTNGRTSPCEDCS